MRWDLRQRRKSVPSRRQGGPRPRNGCWWRSDKCAAARWNGQCGMVNWAADEWERRGGDLARSYKQPPTLPAGFRGFSFSKHAFFMDDERGRQSFESLERSISITGEPCTVARRET